MKDMWKAAWRDIRICASSDMDTGEELPLSGVAAKCYMKRQYRNQPLAERLLWFKCK